MINGTFNNGLDGLRQQNLLDSNRLQEEKNQGRPAEYQTELKEQLLNNSDSVSIQVQKLSAEGLKLADQMSEEEIQMAMDKVSNSYSQDVHNSLDPQRVAFLTGI
jgi:hypothetical protein